MTHDTIVLSLRQMRRVPWSAGLVQAEDVLVEALDALRCDVVADRPWLSDQSRRARAAQRLTTIVPASEPFTTDPQPDVKARLLVILVTDLHDLALCTSVRDWDHLADEVLVHVAEVSERHLKIYGSALRRVQRCPNHLYLGSRYVDPERLAGKRTKSLGVSVPLVDVLAYPERPHAARPVDVLSFGRSNPRQHALLERWAAARPGRRFDRDHARLETVDDLHDHRRSFIDRAVQARVIITNHARFDEPKRTAGLRMLGTRFIEAAAAGAVLAGDPPLDDLPGFEGLLDELRISRFDLEATSLPRTLREVLDEPSASQEIGAHVRAVALEQLDVAHQWARIAASANLPITPGVIDRLQKLDEVQHLSGQP